MLAKFLETCSLLAPGQGQGGLQGAHEGDSAQAQTAGCGQRVKGGVTFLTFILLCGPSMIHFSVISAAVIRFLHPSATKTSSEPEFLSVMPSDLVAQESTIYNETATSSPATYLFLSVALHYDHLCPGHLGAGRAAVARGPAELSCVHDDARKPHSS